MYALARSVNGINVHFRRIIHMNTLLVCASGLEGCNAIDSFQAAIASSYSSASRINSEKHASL